MHENGVPHQLGGPGTGQAGFMSRGETFRLLGMVFFLVVMTGFMFSFLRWAPVPEDGEPLPTTTTHFPVHPERPKDPSAAMPLPPELPPPLPAEVPPFEPDAQALAGTQDFSPGLDDPALYYLLHQVATMTQEQIEARADTPRRPKDFWFEGEALRGQWFRVRGTLLDFFPWLLETIPNRTGLQMVYRGVLIDSGNRPFQFLVLEKDKEYLDGKENVELSGVFYKVLTFRTRHDIYDTGNHPIFIARKIVPYRKPTLAESYPWGFSTVAGAVVVLAFLSMVVAVLVMLRADRRRMTEFRARFRRPVRNEDLRTHTSPAWRERAAERRGPDRAAGGPE